MRTEERMYRDLGAEPRSSFKFSSQLVSSSDRKAFICLAYDDRKTQDNA